MAKEHEKKRWWEYPTPMWLRIIAAMYVTLFGLYNVWELARLHYVNPSPYLPLIDGLFILGFFLILAVNYLWVRITKKPVNN